MTIQVQFLKNVEVSVAGLGYQIGTTQLQAIYRVIQINLRLNPKCVITLLEVFWLIPQNQLNHFRFVQCSVNSKSDLHLILIIRICFG